MDKGQHLRLFIKDSGNHFFALATSLTFHVSAQVETSTTKDSTDETGQWDENEPTGLSGDIQIGALIGVGTDTNGVTLNDVLNNVNDSAIDWELALVGNTNNRTVKTTIATGKGKITNVNPTGTNRQNATYTATINLFGPYTVAS